MRHKDQGQTFLTGVSIFSILFLLPSCLSFMEPREIDWEREWKSHKQELKSLVDQIKSDSAVLYSSGMNEFPKNFDYPFDEGFDLKYIGNSSPGTTKLLYISFYLDRGIADHFSAIIYTNDTSSTTYLDKKVQRGGNDFRLEEGWYAIND